MSMGKSGLKLITYISMGLFTWFSNAIGMRVNDSIIGNSILFRGSDLGIARRPINEN